MGALSLLGFGTFVGASLAAGARLLWTARRSRDPGELAVGVSLALVGAGYAAMIAAFRLALVPEASFPAAFALATALLDLGVVMLLVGVWRVFRANARWAVVLVVAGAAVLTTSWVRGVAGFRPDAERTPFVFWSFNATALAAYAWCAVECARERAALRSRADVGLADAAVARRFGLWCLAAFAGAGVFAAGLIGRLLVAGGHPGAQLAQSLAALAAGVATGLAFLLPTAFGVGAAGPFLRRTRSG